MAKKKKCCKAKKENTDLMKIKVLEEKLNEILSKPTVMSGEEQKIVSEVREELNQIKNLIKNK